MAEPSREKRRSRTPMALAPRAEATPDPRSLALPSGALESGTLERVEEPARWEEVRARLRRATGVEIPPFDGRSVLLLVGADRLPADCERALLEPGPQGPVLRIPIAVGADAGIGGGCAVIVARDAAPREVVLPSGARLATGIR